MKHWLSAMRLRTLPLALASISMGSFLAASVGRFELSIFILALLTTIGLQILSNLANDYGDSIHGADNVSRKGPSRQVQQGLITLDQMRKAIFVCAVITLGIGITLLVFAGLSLPALALFLLLGLISVGAAILYTNGSKPYGYLGLGDLAVFLFFGWLGVLGTYFLMTSLFEVWLFLPASSLGLFTVAVLNVNNIRDIESDRKAGKISIPVRLGRQKAVFYHWTLLALGLLLTAIFVGFRYSGLSAWFFLFVIPFLYINARAVSLKSQEGELDPYLKQMAISTLFFVVFFGIGIIL